MITACTSLPVMLEPISGEAMIRAGEIAAARSLSLYDGCYLELAVARGCPLATFDRALAGAASAVGVPLVDGR